MFASATTSPTATTDPGLSPALQAHLRECVRERLREEGRNHSPWFRIHLYLRLGCPVSAAQLDRELRQHTEGGRIGMIALFGQLAPGLDIQTAMARQLLLMHGCDKQLHLVTPPSEKRVTCLHLGSQRFDVLTLHEDADSLRRVMPCPMLVFCPAE